MKDWNRAVRPVRGLLLVACLACVFNGPATAQVGTLAEPFAPPDPNAALHYQRALLFLSALDDNDQAQLKNNLWDVWPDAGQKLTGRMQRLLYRGRFAVDAAAQGSRLSVCDFGIDFGRNGAATVMPHVQPMVRLGRLVVLRGAYAQTREKWDEAIIAYFDALRMGRHMTHGPTLLEALAGMQILENAYFAMAQWAVACPDQQMVARAFGMLESVSDRLVNPTRTIASESNILAMEFKTLRAHYPDGNWGTQIINGLELTPGETEEANRKLAIEECVKQGVPRRIFDDAETFRSYIDRLEAVAQRFSEAAAACMHLSGAARVERGRKLHERYLKRLGAVGESELLDPAEIGAIFSSHEAKLAVLRGVMALAIRKTDQGFPKELSAVAGAFGGQLPTSPYDGSDLKYEVSENGTAFRLSVRQVEAGGLVLPSVDYSNTSPTSTAD